MEIVQKEGEREVNRSLEFYNLDMIIAVGYRVNSKKATKFRQWATQTLKEYIQKGYLLNMDMLKNRRRVLEGKGRVSHGDALKKAVEVYEQFCIQQDRNYISNSMRQCRSI